MISNSSWGLPKFFFSQHFCSHIPAQKQCCFPLPGCLFCLRFMINTACSELTGICVTLPNVISVQMGQFIFTISMLKH